MLPGPAVALCFVALVCCASAVLAVAKDCPECAGLVADCKKEPKLEALLCEAAALVCETVLCPPDEVVHHLPFSDNDGDKFSTEFGLRGYAWRGRDCNDNDPKVYPGRRTPAGETKDVNCNGIEGGNSSGTFEELYCGGEYAPRQLILLSDSTGAHFCPPISPFAGPETWARNAEDEFDWPACSWATGYLPAEECLFQHGPKLSANSFYSMMVKRNACNRGQVQNIAVNGARSSSMSASIVQTTAGSGVEDSPSLVLLALSANDVCNPHPWKNIHENSHMTTPEEWIRNNLITLRWLEEHLAPGSDVIFTEMMHGAEFWQHSSFMSPYGYPWSIIWEFISNHTQGCDADDLRGDCRTLNPCWGWLNPDPEVRKNTTAWADSLNVATKKLITEHASEFKNFKLRMMPHVDLEVQNAYTKKYGFNEVTNLYSQFGGGHPSQVASILWGEAFWAQVETLFPEVLGKQNPRNAEIEAKFPWKRGGYSSVTVH